MTLRRAAKETSYLGTNGFVVELANKGGLSADCTLELSLGYRSSSWHARFQIDFSTQERAADPRVHSGRNILQSETVWVDWADKKLVNFRIVPFGAKALAVYASEHDVKSEAAAVAKAKTLVKLLSIPSCQSESDVHAAALQRNRASTAASAAALPSPGDVMVVAAGASLCVFALVQAAWCCCTRRARQRQQAEVADLQVRVRLLEEAIAPAVAAPAAGQRLHNLHADEPQAVADGGEDVCAPPGGAHGAGAGAHRRRAGSSVAR